MCPWPRPFWICFSTVKSGLSVGTCASNLKSVALTILGILVLLVRCILTHRQTDTLTDRQTDNRTRTVGPIPAVYAVHLAEIHVGLISIHWRRQLWGIGHVPLPRLPTVFCFLFSFFFFELQSHTNSDVRLHVVAYPVQESWAIAKMTARCPFDFVYGCPENFQESLTTLTATFPEFFNGLLFRLSL